MKILYFFYIVIFLVFGSVSKANENFFSKAKILYNKKDFKESKFLFQRNIVFNPKDAKSYFYLAKIFQVEENEQEKIKNLNTSLLLDPNNEEAVYMKIDIELERSNFSEVKKLSKKFEVICTNLCEKINLIEKRLKNIDSN
tara:strand:+ start:2025 stop:2447 length:423 start_codon:yes stop_codon:yes gene_type:complete